MSSKGWIQTIANQGREGIQKLEKQSKVGTASRVLVPTQRNMHNNVFEPPPRWRMVTSDWTQDSWSTTLLPHHQPIKKGHRPCNPHLKCCLLFLGTRDDHPVRSPVWLLSISSLRGPNFKTKLLLLQGWMLVSGKKIPWLKSGRERLLLC